MNFLALVIALIPGWFVYRTVDKYTCQHSQRGGGIVTFRLFFSPACGHCQQFMPIWERVVADVSKSSLNRFEKVDVARFRERVPEDVRGVPALYVYDGDKVIDRHVGACDETELRKIFDSY
jgi:thioredoxin-like negative regulator of GroEL